MKLVFNKLLLLCGFLFLIACGDMKSESGVYRVRIPLSEGGGQYRLKTVELRSVKDLPAMVGDVAYLKLKGSQTEETIGDKHYITDFNQGQTPNAHFVKQDGVYHPADYMSLTMTTIMYHFERIKDLSDRHGASRGISFPRPILVEFKEHERVGNRRSKKIDNAFFSPTLSLFVLLPYSGDKIPLAMNGGILAHEFAHNIFYEGVAKSGFDVRSFFKTLSEPEASFQEGPTVETIADEVRSKAVDLNRKEIITGNRVLYQGVDEGFADYWGYLYSGGSTDWLYDSAETGDLRNPEANKRFKCTKESQKLTIKAAVQKVKDAANVCDLEPHNLGSFFSTMVVLTAKEKTPDVAVQMMLEFLPKFGELLSKSLDSRFLTVNDAVQLFFKGRPISPQLRTRVAKLFSSQITESEIGNLEEEN